VVVDRTLLAFDYLHGLPVEAAATAAPPLGPTGGAALYRTGAFVGAGGFDDRIFAYLEDVDLALRVRSGGGACRLAPDAQGIHRHSATLGSGSAWKNELMGWSRGYLLRRYGVLRDPGLAVRAVIGEAVLCAGQAVVDHTLSGVVGRIKGWRAADGLDRHVRPSGAALDLSLVEALRQRAGPARARRSHR
jgi:hypothetical protein